MEVRLEQLIGAKVCDPRGRVVGRLEEIEVERTPDGWRVQAYLIGPAGLVRRFQLGEALRTLGLGSWARVGGYRASWEQLDVTGGRLRLRCEVAQLERLPRDDRDSP